MVEDAANPVSPPARVEDWAGLSAERTFCVTEAMISDFAELTGDRSPIHVDPDAAKRRGFDGRLAHGALISGLVSCVIGMDLPGPRGLLQELAMRYRRPCLPGDELTVTVTVSETYASVQTVRLDVRVTNQRGELVATGKAQSGVGES